VEPILIPAGAVIAVIVFVGSRWLLLLQRKSDDHAERIAYLEAKVNGREKHEQH